MLDNRNEQDELRADLIASKVIYLHRIICIRRMHRGHKVELDTMFFQQSDAAQHAVERGCTTFIDGKHRVVRADHLG